MEYLPSEFQYVCKDSDDVKGTCNNNDVKAWVSRLDQSRGFYTWTTGRPVPVEPLSVNDVIVELDRCTDQAKRSKLSAAARQASIDSGDYAKRFDHFSKDIDPSEYMYAMKVHATWCDKCTTQLYIFKESDYLM